jgi:dTDP-4-amino-4,6-dideoxygalactose transaminase
VVTDDDAIARRMFLFINKAWGYGDPNPDHYFLALNYRLSELQGAVALGQLDKLDQVLRSRIESAAKLTSKIVDLPGIETPWVGPKSSPAFWKYCLRVDSTVVEDGSVGLARQLREKGIASAPRYIQKPAYACAVFREQRTFGDSRFPFTLARPEALDYGPGLFPGTLEALDGLLVLPWNERYTDQHIDYIAASLRDAVEAPAGE